MPVWGLFVRLAHWAVAVLVIVELFNEAGANPWHRYLGYAAAALVLARLAWGFFTTGEARLGRMLSVAGEASPYMRALRTSSARVYPGHNPLGALMAFTLWTLILLLGITGWLTQLDRFWGEEWLQELHTAIAYVLGGLVVVHVAGVLVMSRVHGVNLIAAMLTGRKKLP